MRWVVLTVLALVLTAWWWRHRVVACPARFSWLLENPYMRAVAGADILLQRAHVGRGMRVLDAGCGVGRLTIPAAELIGDTGEVVALDLQAAMIARLEERATRAGLNNLRTVVGGIGDGRVERQAYDRVLLVTVLGEIRDRPRALAEIHAALRPGGLLSVTEVIPDPHY